MREPFLMTPMSGLQRSMSVPKIQLIATPEQTLPAPAPVLLAATFQGPDGVTHGRVEQKKPNRLWCVEVPM